MNKIFTLPVNKLRQYILSALAILMCIHASAQISVTATMGTPGPTAYTTLNAAFAAINAGTHGGVINISVTANTTETVVTPLSRTGVGAANYSSILIKPAAATSPVITCAVAAGGPIRMNGVSGVTIDGSNTVGGTTTNLTIRNTNAAGVYAIFLATTGSGLSGVVIKNCIVTGAGGTNTTGIYCGSNITAATFTASTFMNTDNTIQNCTISGWGQAGIYTFGSGAAMDRNWTITENSVSNGLFEGIWMANSQNSTISYNTISGISTNAAGFCVGIDLRNNVTNVQIFANKISAIANTTTNGAAGILARYQNGGSADIYNNFIANITARNTAGSTNGIGIAIDYSGTQIRIYHNSINQSITQTGPGVGYPSCVAIQPTGGIGNNTVYLVDNVLVNTENLGNAVTVDCWTSNAVFASMNYNDYYCPFGALAYYGAVGLVATLPGVVANFGGNANSISFSPFWISTTDLHLQGIPANLPLNAGTFIASPPINTDIDANPRTAPTMGADELVLCTLPVVSAPISICPGTTATLSSNTLGGTWTSTTTTVATVVTGPSPTTVVSGVPTATAGGTSIITYATSIGCAVTTTVTVIAAPAAITGNTTVCAGSTTQLSNGVAGTWTSSNSSVATITPGPGGGPTGGLVSGTVAGNTTIVFTSQATGCTRSVVVTVAPLPTGITGPTAVCPLSTIALSSNIASGTWTSGTSSVATVTLGGGVVTGVTPGTSLITYTTPSGCRTTTLITVSTPPPPIQGITSVCAGATTILTDLEVGGGTWTSANTNIATVSFGPSANGVVTGVNVGTTLITFTSATTSCYTTTLMTVTSSPGGISGITSLCPGASTTLSNSTPGGIWTSSNTSVGTVVAGPAATTTFSAVNGPGTTTVTYSLGGTCTSTVLMTVSAPPAPIAGGPTVCVGSSIQLSNSVAGGGTWTSASTVTTVVAGPSNATTVTGVASGTSVITFTTLAGCVTTTTITVLAVPGTITGLLTVCTGATITLSNVVAGGTWTSGTTTVATVVPGPAPTTTVTGVSQGTSVITYSNGCSQPTVTVTVFAPPAPIVGPLSVCTGATQTLTNTSVGGGWFSNNLAVATVTPGPTGGGVYTGVSAGTAEIRYTTGCGVNQTVTVTVNAPPANIYGPNLICLGASTILSNDGSPVGVWASSNLAVATIDPVTGQTFSAGIVGTTVITATNLCGSTTMTLTVASPTPIGGVTTFCQNATTQLSNGVAGGTWTSSNTLVAVVDPVTGVVSGVPLGGTGTSNITYTITGGCFTVTTVTTTIAPGPISGIFGICVNATTCLTNSVGGGTWSSTSPSVATINTSSGCVTGLTAGISVISYLVGTCPATATVTVYALPAAITGPSSVCVGSTITLGNLTTPGQWTSGNTISATIDPVTGVLTGVTPPGANITYTTAFGCIGTKSITVNALPGPISGNTTICAASSTVLSNATGAGTWTSSSPAVATVSPSSASPTVIVSAGAGASGTTSVVVTNAAGCQAGTLVTVNPIPSPILGASAMCTGTTATLTATPAGGTWNSSAPVIANIDPVTGAITANLLGTTVITYSLATTCASTMTVTVNQMPPAIIGNPQVCHGFTTTLTNTLAGGTWSPFAGTNVNVNSTGTVLGHTVGIENISYTRAGCSAVVSFTVNPLPLAIIGPTAVCMGSTISLTDLTAGGTWSSSAPVIASVGSGTGIVTGGTIPGTAVIVYTLPTGCTSSVSVTVNAVPAVISGPAQLCAGQSATLSTSMPGGTWTSGNNTIATVIAGPGPTTVITAGSNPGGVVTVSVTTTAGCIRTHTVTVNPIPAPIMGIPLICLNGTTTLTNVTAGGTWSSSNLSVATVLPAGNTVYGVNVGQSRISYILPTGCLSTISVTVNPLPTVIGGNPNVCIGSTTQLSNGTPGGSWSSSTPSVATVNNIGTVFGSTLGQTTITYMLGSGCIQTITVTVNPIPDPITGTFAICNGTCTTLSDATPLGGWTTSSASIATVSAGGTLCGVGAGSARVTYTLSATQCFVTQTITIHPLPAAISGPGSVCEGLTINISTTTSGGAWSSNNSAVATVTTIGPNVVVTGGVAGVANISYTLGTGCAAVKTVTVNVQPGPIIGVPVAICQGSCVQLSDTVAGGVWSSGTASIATVDAFGLVCASGITTGNTNITYTIGTCQSVGMVTVKQQPGAITGNKTICQGSCSTLSSTVGLGAWSSSDISIATVNAATGLVCGSTVNTGTVTITYTLNGCSAMTTVTITPQPGPIQGANSVCNSNCITLSNQVGGGAWSTNSTSVATVNPTTGVVCGIGVGSATITYTIGTCTSLKVINVNVQPSAISGPTQVCNGSSIQLSISTGAGVWSSSNSNVATVNGTGIVTGLSVGTSVISVQIGQCFSTTTITVNPLPSQITGIFFVCQNSQTTLQDLTPGGVWSTSNPAVATVLSTPSGGIYYGVTVGTINATYTLPTGCIATHTLQVIAAPQPIQGPASVCIGGCVQMSNVTFGGTWTSSNPGVATVDPATGIACGAGVSGTVVISYTLGSGCRVVTPLTVYPLTPITGATSVCEGLTTNLSNSTVGGTWSSSNIAIATVNPATGVLTGTGSGSVVIAYTLASGCAATTTITVSPAPAVITGPNNVCVGQTIALTSATASGVWSSSNASIADVDPAGIVTGISAGIAYISYTAGGCPRTFSITVNAASAPITGNTNICVGNTSDLDDATTGGVWTSSNTSVATVDPVTGMVYAIVPGTTTITYAPASGCAASAIVTVNSLPSIIVGPTEVCVGSTIALTDSVAGGAWFSSNYSVADVGFASGIVIGMNPGTAVITYQIFNGCIMGHTVTVNALPTIGGPSQVCVGSTVALSSSPSGGAWTSSAGTGTASVDALGNVTGIGTGTVNITYTNGTTGCRSVITMTVNPLPAPITGNLRICKGGTSLLASTSAGGVWSSSNTFVGSVNPSTGLVQSDANPPVSVFNIIYTLPTGCATQVTMTVVNVPSPISGVGQICVGDCKPLSDTAAGGAWSSFDPTVATVDPVTGQVCGQSAGFTIITYTMGGGTCYQTHVVIVNPLPAPITGNTQVCAQLTTWLSDATPGGVWSSQNPTIASVVTTPAGGQVTGGVTPGGTTIITYTIPTGCFVTTTFVTNPLPAVITGNTNICVGNTVSLSSSPAPGTWSSSNTLVATVPNPTLGVIYGFDYNVPPGAPYGVANITYTLAGTGCIRTTTVAVHPLPHVYAVTGGGSYCSGTGGVHVGLSGSQIGVNYYLYLGTSTPTGPIAGTGGPLDFGLQTVGGVYTVIANNTFTTCSSNMTGSATITVIPSVAPTVTIMPSPNDTVCAGTAVTFIPMATNEGTSPVYNWSVNGLLMSVGASYTFVPADGDIVTVVLNSNAICAVPNVARDTLTMAVYPSAPPAVSILVSPNDSVCTGTAATFTAIPYNGGPSPVYHWYVNNVVAGTGSTYTYTPANGDQVFVEMVSNSPCRIGDSAQSGIETIVLVNPVIPVVTITGGGIIPSGSSDTLTANLTGGVAPISYQWYVNGAPVPGATGPNFAIDQTNYGDSIGCLIVNGGFCQEQAFGWTYLQVHGVGVGQMNGANADLSVIPNPTKGTFWIKGSLGSTLDQDVSIELTDVLGQVVYRGNMVAKNGKLNNRVEVSNNLANGMYMLTVRTENMIKVFHLVVEQ